MVHKLLRFGLLSLLVLGLALAMELRMVGTSHAAGEPPKTSGQKACQPEVRRPHVQVVKSPSPGASNVLEAVETISANDIWAVGSSDSKTLIEHWNGQEWKVVQSPSPGSSLNELFGIEAISANDIWAVGDSQKVPGGPFKTLILHWDGQEWKVVQSPSPGVDNFLNAIDAVSANDIWAVGRSDNSTLILHWDGQEWKVVQSPNPGMFNDLIGIEALSANDIWAVGFSDNSTLILHWNGEKWKVVQSPNPGVNNLLIGIDAISANDIWAVGQFQPVQNGPFKTLIEHWNGQEWKVVESPSRGSGDNELVGIEAISANDIWAVGDFEKVPGGPDKTLILHWDGQEWRVVESPNPGVDNELERIDAVSANDIWAVGRFDTRTLIEHITVEPDKEDKANKA